MEVPLPMKHEVPLTSNILRFVFFSSVLLFLSLVQFWFSISFASLCFRQGSLYVIWLRFAPWLSAFCDGIGVMTWCASQAKLISILIGRVDRRVLQLQTQLHSVSHVFTAICKWYVYVIIVNRVFIVGTLFALVSHTHSDINHSSLRLQAHSHSFESNLPKHCHCEIWILVSESIWYRAWTRSTL